MGRALSNAARRIWAWLPARTDARRVTLPSTIAVALTLPLGDVSAALAGMERDGYVVRNRATGRQSGWHRGTPIPDPAGPAVEPEDDWTLY